MAIAQSTLGHQVRASLGALQRPVEATDTTRRIQRLVAVFRLLVAVALLSVAATDLDPPLLEARYPQLFAVVGLGYALFAAAALALQWRRSEAATQLGPAVQVLGPSHQPRSTPV